MRLAAFAVHKNPTHPPTQQAKIANISNKYGIFALDRLNGVQNVVSSNLTAPTIFIGVF
jgi:hypothetical protein